MNDREHLLAILKFLDRTPLEGAEAETMVMAKAWARHKLKELPPPPVLQPPVG